MEMAEERYNTHLVFVQTYPCILAAFCAQFEMQLG